MHRRPRALDHSFDPDGVDRWARGMKPFSVMSVPDAGTVVTEIRFERPHG